MKRAVSMPNMTSPATLVELAVLAEAAGYDGVFLWDHVVYLDVLGAPTVDPWVVLGAIAHATETVRLGPLVTPLSRRRPWRVAQEVCTLDHLSGGRAVLGVGLGWPVEEDFARFGEVTDDRERAALLDDGLAVIDDAWRGSLRPAPVQQPRPPVWVAGMWPNRKPFDRAARWDGICPLKLVAEMDEVPLLRPDELAACVAYVRERRRDGAPFDVVVSPHWEHTPAEYEDAGATWLVTGTSLDADWPDELRRRLQQ